MMPFERFKLAPNVQTSNSSDNDDFNFKWFTFNTNSIGNVAKRVEQKQIDIREQMATKSSDNLAPKSENERKLTSDPILENVDTNTSQLRSRVAQELERIETWKAITEMNIKSKDQKIDEMTKENDELKRKIVSMEREKHLLDLKVIEERDERNEVMVKMNNTREMFYRIKDYVSTIEAKLKTFDEIESIITELNDARNQQLKDLNQNYDDLDTRHKNEVSIIKQIIQERENEICVIKQKMANDMNEKQTELEELSQQLTQLKLEFDRSIDESNVAIANRDNELKKANEQNVLIQNELNGVVNGLNDQLLAKSNECEEIGIRMNQMIEEFNNLKLLHETTEKSAEQNVNQLINEQNILSAQLEALNNCCETLKSEKSGLETRIIELEANIETAKQAYIEEKQIAENEMKIKFDSLIADKESVEVCNQMIINQYETRINELENDIIEKNKAIDDLTKTIDDLKTQMAQMKAAIDERENVEKQLLGENEKLKSDIEMEEKGRQTSARTLKETNKELKNSKLKLDGLMDELETTKQEKNNLEQRSEKEKRSLESQISNMGKILESCKSDYSLRIDDKETRIKELKQEIEKLTIDMNLLYKRNEKVEAEKAKISLKLHELTYSTLQPTMHSPVRVMTPKKFLSPIERVRSSALSSGSPFDTIKPLLSESRIDNNDGKQQISGKQSGNQSGRQKRSISQQKDQQLASMRKTKDTMSKSLYELLETKEMANKEKRQKTAKAKQTPKSTPKSVTNRRKTAETRAKAKTSLDMSSLSKHTEYDVNKIDFDEDFANDKLKPIKTYGKPFNANRRHEDMMKGLPTPIKTDDLSWLNF